MKNNKYLYILLLVILGISSSQEVFEGYTLFTPQIGFGGGATTNLMDNEYTIIQSWEHSNGAASMPYLIPGDEPGFENTLLIYPYRVDNPTMESGGVGGAVQCLSWHGELIWEYVLSNDDYQHHHDVEPLPNGNVLMIAWEKKTASEGYAMGREEIDNPLNQMWSEAIFEIQPDGNGSAEVVWEWHLWDHLVQDYCPDCPNYATISNHPELFNINNGYAGTASGPGGANADWIHINAIHYHEEWDQIVFSSRYQSEIFVIDRYKRQAEYNAIYREEKRKANAQGFGLNKNLVFLPAQVNFDAIFIPDNFKMVNHFAKLFQYYQAKDLTLFGTHEWRSEELVETNKSYLDGSFFVDFIDSPQKFNESRLSPTLDYKLMGYFSGLVAKHALKKAGESRESVTNALVKMKFSKDKAAFRRNEFNWPTYAFEIQENRFIPTN